MPLLIQLLKMERDGWNIHLFMPPLKLIPHGSKEKASALLEVLSQDTICIYLLLGGSLLRLDRDRGTENVTDLLKGEDQLDVSKPVKVVRTDKGIHLKEHLKSARHDCKKKT